MTDGTVSFRWKDYRHEGRNKVMTLDAGEFMRRFLLHVLPPGFHRIRHFGLLANGHRAARLALCRRLLAKPAPEPGQDAGTDPSAASAAATQPGLPHVCPCCGSLHVISSALPRAPPGSAARRR